MAIQLSQVNLNPEKSRVLFVDDEKSILSTLQRLMRQQSFDVDTTDSPEEAFELIQKNHYAVVVSDHRMPGMTGTQLLTKARECSPDTIRILLTGYADMQAALDAINDGAVYHFLNKPWDNDTLCKTIQQAVSFYEMQAENQRLQKTIQIQNKELASINEKLEEKVEQRTQTIYKLVNDLEKSFMGTVQVLASLSEMHSTTIGSHSKRVSRLSVAIGQEMGMDDATLKQLEVAALLHDIGKVAISSDILNKPAGQLQRFEKEKLQQHPIYGENMLSMIPNFKQAAKFIRHHHEHFSGLGYPDELKGEGIPLASRIIAVADAYDKTMNSQLLSQTMTQDQAIKYLKTHAEKEFDSSVIRALEQYLELQTESENAEKIEIEIYSKDLRSGMTLSKDIVTMRGLLLLKKDSLIEERHVSQLQKILEVDPAAEGIFIYR